MGGDAKDMGLEWKLTLVDTYSYDSAMTWDLLAYNSTIKGIKEYIKEHPMPKSVTYKNANEIIKNIEKVKDGIITIANNETEEFKSWFIELVNMCCW